MNKSLCQFCYCTTNHSAEGAWLNCLKYKTVKIRKSWKRNPKTQIAPNKKKQNRQEIKLDTKRLVDESC